MVGGDGSFIARRRRQRRARWPSEIVAREFVISGSDTSEAFEPTETWPRVQRVAGDHQAQLLNQQNSRFSAPNRRPVVIAMIKTIFAQETAEAAQQREQVADALREKFPKLADMDTSREDALACSTLETLGSVSHNPIVSLPASAA